MPLGADDVRHVAALARLSLSAAEVDEQVRQLGRILDHIERLRACDTEGVPPTAHALALTGGLRDDAVRPSLPVEAALANAPAAQNGFFLVPRVVEGGA